MNSQMQKRLVSKLGQIIETAQALKRGIENETKTALSGEPCEAEHNEAIAARQIANELGALATSTASLWITAETYANTAESAYQLCLMNQ